MTLIVDERPVRFRWETAISLAEFPELLTRFQQNVPSRPNRPTTADIERRAAQLAQGDFQDQDLQQFIRTVCRWGGFAGIGGRIIKNNQPDKLATFFRAAYQKAHDSLTGRLSESSEMPNCSLRYLLPAGVLGSLTTSGFAQAEDVGRMEYVLKMRSMPWKQWQRGWASR